MRPTTDKVREAVFNSLLSLGGVDGAHVLDLFAGTGACGIEALSRGADRVTFVDADPRALAVVRQNLESTGLGAAAEVVRSDALAFLARRSPAAGAPTDEPAAVPAPFDVAFIDPPYRFAGWDEVLAARPAPLVVCESDRPLVEHDGWTEVRKRRYGITWVTILREEGT